MFELHGRYNTAKVFTDNCDNGTVSQILTLLNQAFTKDAKIRIMPDTHAGTGCVIGTTMTIQDKLVPNLVGTDISCGMLCIRLQETEFDPARLDNIIRTCVPSDRSVSDTEHTALCQKPDTLLAPVSASPSYKSISALLGGGNHYIEVDKDWQGSLYLVIHSGSRHLGIHVARHYQERAVKNCRRTNIPKDLCCIEGQDLEDYLHDMKILDQFARNNRQKIANNILHHMGWNMADSFTTTHNYVDDEQMILRKGAVSAQTGEKLIIPINMRDGALLCTGKGNPDWNCSAPHGAGRRLSRSQAKDLIPIQKFKDVMSGIYSSSVCTSTISEAPQAYKPMQEIIGNILDTVTIRSVITPVYNFKAH